MRLFEQGFVTLERAPEQVPNHTVLVLVTPWYITDVQSAKIDYDC